MAYTYKKFPNLEHDDFFRVRGKVGDYFVKEGKLILPAKLIPIWLH